MQCSALVLRMDKTLLTVGHICLIVIRCCGGHILISKTDKFKQDNMDKESKNDLKKFCDDQLYIAYCREQPFR